ncbi:hypothetical protein [Cardinium endosymbiont of Tipula unca]|uniref:hypothetical protein n=1 Tax=Cardinium endosymbiont of Tipula unca TaxID=3066216 RepID=UPI0030D4DE21
MLFCSIKGANRGYIQVLLATSRNRIYFRRRSIIRSPLVFFVWDVVFRIRSTHDTYKGIFKDSESPFAKKIA